MTNVAWSPSPIGDSYNVWGAGRRRATTSSRDALTLVPADASVTATYQLLPHLSHREQIYDWPNPFVPAYWGNDDCYRLPVADGDRLHRASTATRSAPAQQQLFSDMIAPGGPFQVLFDQSDIVVAKRVGTSTAVDVTPQEPPAPASAARRSTSAPAADGEEVLAERRVGDGPLDGLAGRHDQRVEQLRRHRCRATRG